MPLKFTILGCGSSMGVPRSDGYFGKCNPKNKNPYCINNVTKKFSVQK